MNIEWFLLLLPIAAISGWFSGRGSVQKKLSNYQQKISSKYIVGFNQLLNEQPDKAIDTFIQLLEVDSDTVETHLALGSLFRRRGEVDRALRLHQNIIARPTLSEELRYLAMFELGLDYSSAGMLDRAEYLFDDLKQIESHKIESLQQLLTIYQSTKDWDNAISISKQLQKLSGDNLQVEIGHFYCELADLAIATGSIEEAHKNLKKALKIDENSVRASLLEAQIALSDHQWKTAISNYETLLSQDSVFFTEAVSGLCQSFEALNDSKGFQALLLKATEKGAGATVMLTVAECIAAEQGDKVAAQFITQHLRITPSIRGLQSLIKLHLEHSSEKAKDSLMLLQEVVDSLLLDKPSHRCESCGFESKQLYWHCPSCKNWGVVKPIIGIEGE